MCGFGSKVNKLPNLPTINSKLVATAYISHGNTVTDSSNKLKYFKPWRPLPDGDAIVLTNEQSNLLTEQEKKALELVSFGFVKTIKPWKPSRE
jgi:hypothetical protein